MSEKNHLFSAFYVLVTLHPVGSPTAFGEQILLGSNQQPLDYVISGSCFIRYCELQACRKAKGEGPGIRFYCNKRETGDTVTDNASKDMLIQERVAVAGKGKLATGRRTDPGRVDRETIKE